MLCSGFRFEFHLQVLIEHCVRACCCVNRRQFHFLRSPTTSGVSFWIVDAISFAKWSKVVEATMVTLKLKQMHLPPDCLKRYFLLIYNVTRNCIFFCKYCFYFFGTFLCLWCLGRRKSLEQGAFLNAGGQGFSAYTFLKFGRHLLAFIFLWKFTADQHLFIYITAITVHTNLYWKETVERQNVIVIKALQ